MFGIRLGVFVLALICSVSIGAILQAQNPPAPPAAKPPELSAEAKIESALSRKVSLDVVDEPLHEVLKKLANQAQIQIVLTKKIEDAGVQRDQPVTMVLKDISLRSVLRNLLGGLNLTFMVKDDVLKITTEEDASSPENQLTRVYGVKDLVTKLKKHPHEESDLEFDSLIAQIRDSFCSDTWSEFGGPSTMKEEHNSASLVISSRKEIHEQVISYLAALRQLKAAHTGAIKSAPLPVSIVIGREIDLEHRRKVDAALAKTVSYSFADEPLKDVCAKISQDFGFPVLLAKKVEDAGVQPDQPVTIDLEKVSLRSFLRKLLGDLNLTFIIQDEVLKLTTVEDAQSPESLVVRVYPVRDLVEWLSKEPGQPPELDFGPLFELITDVIEPDSWRDGGGEDLQDDVGTGSMVIAQRDHIHEKIADLLTQLRKAKSAQGLDRPVEATNKPVPPPGIPPPVTPPKR